MTDEFVAPLDAYATAKPDEPVFTLQGGDPLAPPLVKLWAVAARCRAGVISVDKFLTSDALTELANAAIRHSVDGDERECDSLKVRATAAEQVSWVMDEYAKGDYSTDKPTEAADTHLTELERIDLHDLKVRIAQKLSGFRCEIAEMCDALLGREFDVETLGRLAHAGTILGELKDVIEPRRMFRKD